VATRLEPLAAGHSDDIVATGLVEVFKSAAVPFTHKLFGPAGKGPPRGRGKSAPEGNPALQDLWHVIAAIPSGQVSTYGEVARAAGLPGRARMTAYALRIAPEDLALPWHRVLGAGGRIVFPTGSKHFQEQARRLRSEGIKVTQGKVPPTALTDLARPRHNP
jgi:methylated-DNA-protein-cysteine methyltransferase related protein